MASSKAKWLEQRVLTELRKSLAARLEVALESGAFLSSLLGASLAAAFGRFLLAVPLAMMALGIGFRLVRRRQAQRTPTRPAAWVRAGSLLLALLEVTLLVEATGLPVRFQQEGFSYLHWALVVLAIFVAYRLQVRVLARLVR